MEKFLLTKQQLKEAMVFAIGEAGFVWPPNIDEVYYMWLSKNQAILNDIEWKEPLNNETNG